MAEAVRTLPEGKPDHSLGIGVLNWCSEWLRQPDGPDAGQPWQFTREQARFVLWWYAVDQRGRWLYTRGVLRRPKGWGKTPMVAALALAELCGPVRFDRWEDGEPVGVPVGAAWVQLAGVSEKQTSNTMSMVIGMLAESPVVHEYGLDVGLTRIYTAIGGRLEPITASSATAEGARPTFVVEDETQHWTEGNNAADLDRVNRRNLGKSRDGSARMLETTNAHALGQDSVAERSFQAYLAVAEGRSRDVGLLYDSCEAPADVDLGDEDSLMAALKAAYGDSTWVDLERVRSEVWDPSTPPDDARRFYLNQIAAAVDSWIAEIEWAARVAADKVVADGDVVTLGFDGSRARARGITDATALIGCRVEDGHIFELGIWEQPPGPMGAGWQVPALEVEAAVAEAFRRYTVVGFYADPPKWEGTIATWEARYSPRLKVRAARDHPIEWWTNRLTVMARAIEQFHSAVLDGGLTHDGSFALTRHVLNARRRVGRAGTLIGKENPESPRKIDAAIAAVLAWQARLEAVAAGITSKPVMFVPRRIR
jgi:phage terminase large subunit-like protein